MWEISVGAQAYACLYSLALGGILCAFYDTIRATRKIGLNSAVAVFVGDLVFWLVSAVTVFLFLIAVTNGEIRGYVIFFCTAGFLIYRFTIGKAAFYLLCLALSFIRKILKRFFILQRRFACAAARSADKLILKPARSVFEGSKKLLKSIYNLLYTKIYKDKMGYDADE